MQTIASFKLMERVIKKHDPDLRGLKKANVSHLPKMKEKRSCTVQNVQYDSYIDSFKRNTSEKNR